MWLQKFSARNFDWVLGGAVFLLVAMGFAAIYSVDLSHGSGYSLFRKQFIAASIGLALLFWASSREYSFFRASAKWWYLCGAAGLLLVLFAGNTIRGTRGWFVVGGFSFQPVEFAKVGIILLLSYIIFNFGRQFYRPLFFFGTGTVTFLLMGLVMLQPDLGSAILIMLIWFGLIWLVGTPRSYLLLFGAAAIGIAIIGWFFLLHDYQKARLMTFVSPAYDPLGSGYNVIQATIAVGAGGWFGRGLGFGSQSQLRFLPEAQTDFVFSVIGEELGMLGVMCLIALFAVILWRLFRIVATTSDDFVAATVGGIALLFFFQMCINIGANVGLLPVTGITLPFVSYGGSSLIINLLLIGIAESMSRRL